MSYLEKTMKMKMVNLETLKQEVYQREKKNLFCKFLFGNIFGSVISFYYVVRNKSNRKRKRTNDQSQENYHIKTIL